MSGSDALAEARETISRLESEIAELRGRLDDEHFARELREILTTRTRPPPSTRR
jgi:hypothetical protein